MENLKIIHKISLILVKIKENILVIIIYFGCFLNFLLRFLIFIQFNFCHKLYTRISRKFFKNYLYKNYLFHTQNNSSELIRNVIGEGNLFSIGVICPLIRVSSEILIFVSICILLFVYEPLISLLNIIFFSLIFYFFFIRKNNKLKIWGKTIPFS